MRKKTYTQNVNCPLTEKMFKELTEITNKLQITYSKFIREAIEKYIKDVKNG